MDSTTIGWINTILLAVLGTVLTGIAIWFYHKIDGLLMAVPLMATKDDMKEMKEEIKEKIDEKDCIVKHDDVKKYLHQHSSTGEAVSVK
jgi:hypothetical protein